MALHPEAQFNLKMGGRIARDDPERSARYAPTEREGVQIWIDAKAILSSKPGGATPPAAR